MALVLIGTAVAIATLAGVAPQRLLTRRGLLSLALLALGEVVALTWFVRADDPYVADGRPRWDFYQGGATHPLFWATIALDLAAAALLAAAAARRLRAIGYGGLLATISALVTGALTVFGFSLN